MRVAILDAVLRAGEGKALRRVERIAAAVTAAEPDVASLSDDALAAKTAEFQSRLAAGESVDGLLVEAFAVVREASKRVLGMRHFDVQIMGGATLHLGNIAEMKTGEGKTLVATLPAYLNALTGKGVHVVTTNDYLAARDGAKMARIHAFLGLSVGILTAGMPHRDRVAAYQADITYGTNSQFGFDYLRDNMATDPAAVVQRGHHFAVVDEVDSILIDEARTPLIISGTSDDSAAWYPEFARIADRLIRDLDYIVDEKKETIGVLPAGVKFVQDWIGVENLYVTDHVSLIAVLGQSLRAKELFHRDEDYIVAGGEVLIVDEHTGRTLAGRRYSDGLHQALEAKERVRVQPENETLATVTLQNYFRLYGTLSGMTGTGATEAAEFLATYALGVVPIPSNRPNRRVDEPDVIYRRESAKFTAVIEQVAARHATGQPVLIGTTSVEKSERVSALLTARGIAHNVLNAKENAREAHIITQAGRLGAVTVATNMAGRGTDILLGGNPDVLARDTLAGRGIDPADSDYPELLAAELVVAEQVVAGERAAVTAAGGLHVIGTERHESRRIDNQLRGRAGRQGDPGSTRFYLSLEDEIIVRFSGTMLGRAMDALGAADIPVQSSMVNRSVNSAQQQMESRNYDIRKDVVKYDDVLTKQREAFYTERLRLLTGHDVLGELRRQTRHVCDALVAGGTAGYPEQWDLPALAGALAAGTPADVTAAALAALTDADAVRDTVRDAAAAGLAARMLEAGTNAASFVRTVMLTVADRAWRAHLQDMEYLRSGIHLRSVAQKNPLVEYQREGYQLFLAMVDQMRTDIVGYCAHLPLPVPSGTPGEGTSAGDDAVEDAEPADTAAPGHAAQPAADLVFASTGDPVS